MLFNFCFYIGIIGIIILIVSISAVAKYGMDKLKDGIWEISGGFLACLICIYCGINEKAEVEHKVIEAYSASCTDTNCTLNHSDSRRYFIVLSNGERYEIKEDEYAATKIGDIKYVSRFE